MRIPLYLAIPPIVAVMVSTSWLNPTRANSPNNSSQSLYISSKKSQEVWGKLFFHLENLKATAEETIRDQMMTEIQKAQTLQDMLEIKERYWELLGESDKQLLVEQYIKKSNNISIGRGFDKISATLNSINSLIDNGFDIEKLTEPKVVFGVLNNSELRALTDQGMNQFPVFFDTELLPSYDEQSWSDESTDLIILAGVLAARSSGSPKTSFWEKERQYFKIDIASASNISCKGNPNCLNMSAALAFEDYKFTEIELNIEKEIFINYYVIDPKDRRWFKGTFLKTLEPKLFTAGHGRHGLDREMVDEKYPKFPEFSDVTNFMGERVDVKVSEIFDDFLKKKPEPYETTAKLTGSNFFAELKVGEDQTQTITCLKPKEIIVKMERGRKSVNDVLRSLVHVSWNVTPDKINFGTGFYIQSDLVLTNYHVLRGSRVVNVKGYEEHAGGGKSFLGVVIGYDARRDLALLKVQKEIDAELVVPFHKSGRLDLGSEVLAFGHPKGLEFGVSKGIVSAIRDGSNLGLKRDPDVKYIQIDAAINKGNSGGPLLHLYGGTIIGVNTLGMSKDTWEGLNFAIHYDEINAFLRQQNVGVISPDGIANCL